MSVQLKGSGTIGGLDEGLVVSGIVTSSTQINVGSNIKLGSAGVVTATSFVGSGAQLTGITSPAITSIDSDAVSRVLTTDGDGTATAHSEVKIETVSGNKRFSINRGTGSAEVPLLVRRTDASGIVAEFSNSSGYGVYIGQNGATGEGYIRTATGQPLVFTTNSGSGIANERVRIDSSGRIGIGENNPTRDIVIKKSGSVQVSMVGATNQNVFLNFGDTDDDNIGGVYYDNTNNRMIIRANTNDAVQVKSNGNMAINDGDLEIGTSGHGISFAATSDASGMTSELLDDYEEGSFSPTLVNGNNGYRFQQGTYTKVGNLVTFTAYIETSATPPSGNLAFGNLPFTSISSRSWVFPFHTNRTSFGTASFDSRAYMGGNSTNVYIYYPVNSSSSNFQPVNQNGMNAANASAVWITGSYQTAS